MRLPPITPRQVDAMASQTRRSVVTGSSASTRTMTTESMLTALSCRWWGQGRGTLINRSHAGSRT